ncbi:MAG: mycoredoxin [Anaerolineales bacterium]|jgi:glutaredoxin-like protein
MASDTIITVYGTTWCFDCVRSRNYLDKHKIAYKWINVDRDPEASAFVRGVNNGMRVVPTIVFPDGSTLAEPSNQQLAEKLATFAR